MEWVEITAKTIEEAKERALDQLGVDVDDAEFEILEEPKAGLFGRVRGEARVRARVRPSAPRSKDAGRRRSRGERTRGSSSEQKAAVATADPDVADAIAQVTASEDGAGGGGGGSSNGPRRRRGGRGRGSRSGATGNGERRPRRSSEDESRGEPVSVEALEQQGEVAVEFLKGLVDSFGLEANVAVRSVNESAVEVAVDGSDLGLLVGPRGATLQAIQDLTRTVVLRETGMREGWVIVDVAEYRVKRRAALEKFALQVADQVTSGGVAVRLDPMPPADRKVVHDVLNAIDGIETASEGEEPRRRVIVKPVAVG
jgi:spoIIIJ-associated protein